MENSWLNSAGNSLLCNINKLPFTYLGLPIGGNLSRIAMWDPIVDRIIKKLVSWKRSLLSIGGRATLIEASLPNLLLYYMSLFPVPKGVIDKTDKSNVSSFGVVILVKTPFLLCLGKFLNFHRY